MHTRVTHLRVHHHHHPFAARTTQSIAGMNWVFKHPQTDRQTRRVEPTTRTTNRRASQSRSRSVRTATTQPSKHMRGRNTSNVLALCSWCRGPVDCAQQTNAVPPTNQPHTHTHAHTHAKSTHQSRWLGDRCVATIDHSS